MTRLLQAADPKAGFLADEAAIRTAIDRVLASGHYILGPEVDAFEAEFAEYQGSGYVIGVANGTEAIELALKAVGVRPGDVVLTVANTVSATAAAIQQIGATPQFVEVYRDTMCMSASALEAELTRTTARAVLPVHLYGNPADVVRIAEVCRSAGVALVEDCAQAHGATLAGSKVGNFGQAAAFSFYPTKNLGALGDGGAVFTRDEEIAGEVRLLRQYGWRTRYISEIPGRNSRLDEIQAAVLRVKLQSLDRMNARRDELAKRYSENLTSSPLTLPVATEGARHVWHQYAVRAHDREALRARLLEDGINAASLYPVPLHHQPAYLDTSLQLPITEQACREVLSLPCHPGLEPGDVDRVCEVILR